MDGRLHCVWCDRHRQHDDYAASNVASASHFEVSVVFSLCEAFTSHLDDLCGSLKPHTEYASVLLVKYGDKLAGCLPLCLAMPP